MQKDLHIALLGNPNCGKTSLFNALTGLHHKVSNFPGTTVEQKTGLFKLDDQTKIRVTDLPGTYSLYHKSVDEQVTYETLFSETGECIDLVVFIADASNLKRNLFLLTQLLDAGLPTVLCLNMLDVAERKGIRYDTRKLAEMTGVPVLEMNARNRTGIDSLKQLLKQGSFVSPEKKIFQHAPYPGGMTAQIQGAANFNDYARVQAAINRIQTKGNKTPEHGLFCSYGFDINAYLETEIFSRYRFIEYIIQTCKIQKKTALPASYTRRIDRILTHRIWGIVLFLVLLFFIFQAMFSWSEYPKAAVEYLFTQLEHGAKIILPSGVFADLIIQGILPGLMGVVVFLPQIILLFLFIGILEDIGYMARLGFIMDRIMRPFGMNGKSIVPLIGGTACAVPSIMACRSIENPRERLITILVIPLMSCSARLPVYTLLIGMIVPESATWGPFNLHGLVLMFMYLFGFVSGLLIALVFKRFLKNEQNNYFLLELPGYKVPVWQNVLISLYDKSSAFVVGAGKIIVAVSVVLWLLASNAPGNRMHDIEKQYAAMPANLNNQLQMNADKLEASYAGEFGKFIEPAIRPLGFDWKIGIALITSLAAREVFVGTMSTIYSVNTESNDGSLSGIQEKMQHEMNPESGHRTYRLATLISLMIFYAFALQCISTIATVKSETGSSKWAIIQFVCMTALAYGCSFLAFQWLS